jgi:glycine hydroxymethyltransferase
MLVPLHSGVIWRAVHYGVDPATGRIDHDLVRDQARRERPKLIIAGGSAYARIIDFAAFRSIADEVGAIFLVDMAHFAGLVAGGIYPSPVPHSPVVTSTTHKTLRGPRAGLILCAAEHAKASTVGLPRNSGRAGASSRPGRRLRQALTPDFARYAKRWWPTRRRWRNDRPRVRDRLENRYPSCWWTCGRRTCGKDAEDSRRAGITVNKNTIPSDPQSPFVTSGIRLGTPPGHGQAEMRRSGAIDRSHQRMMSRRECA